jgi:hypothetical protein
MLPHPNTKEYTMSSISTVICINGRPISAACNTAERNKLTNKAKVMAAECGGRVARCISAFKPGIDLIVVDVQTCTATPDFFLSEAEWNINNIDLATLARVGE